MKILAKAIGHQNVIHNLKVRKNIHAPENYPPTRSPLKKLIVCFSRFREKHINPRTECRRSDRQTDALPWKLIGYKKWCDQILYFHWLAINKSCIIADGTRFIVSRSRGGFTGSDCFSTWNRFLVLLSFFASLSVSLRYHSESRHWVMVSISCTDTKWVAVAKFLAQVRIHGYHAYQLQPGYYVVSSCSERKKFLRRISPPADRKCNPAFGGVCESGRDNFASAWTTSWQKQYFGGSTDILKLQRKCAIIYGVPNTTGN